MWPRLHSRDGTGTGTAFPSPHSLPCAGNIFPRAEAGGRVIWRDGRAELSLLGKHCHLLASSTLSALLSPYFSSAASWPSRRACLLQAAHGLQSLPRALQAATTCACHLSALTTSLCLPPPPPSDSSPILEHTWPALAPGLLRACLSLCLGSRTLLPRGIGQLLPHLFQVFAQMARYYLG